MCVRACVCVCVGVCIKLTPWSWCLGTVSPMAAYATHLHTQIQILTYCMYTVVHAKAH